MPDEFGERLLQSSLDWTPDLGAVQTVKTRRRRRRNAAGGAAAALLLVVAAGGVIRFADRAEQPTELIQATTPPEPSVDPTLDPTVEPTVEEIIEPDTCQVLTPDASQLTPAAAETYNAIVNHLNTRCDDLTGLAALGGPDFMVDFGGGDPVETWGFAIENDTDVQGILAELLSGPSGPLPDGTTTVWPLAAALAALPEDPGPAYDGPRVGITLDGDWTFFILGGD